jgi:hypothetical protein
VTAYSPYQAYPGPAAPELVPQPPPVLVAVAEPKPQPRWGVAFRALLAIPHAFLVDILGIVAGLIAFIGWWAALFTGQLPEFAVSFLSGFLRWELRVRAYLLLLTDEYPPFTLDDDPTYPVRLAIPRPQRLNRAAVFFRCVLAIPAALLVFIVSLGASTLMAFVAWLVTLVLGRMPASLHLAYASVLRFEARYTAYYYMLTPAYPGGLYGDKPGVVAWADGLPETQAPGFGSQAAFGTPGAPYGTPGPGYGNPADGTPQAYGSPQGYDAPQGYGSPAGYGSPGYGAPAGYDPTVGYGASPAGATGGYGAPVGYGVPATGYSPRPVFQPATWLLPLTSAARKLLTTFIVIGVLFFAGYIAFYVAVIGSAVSSATNNNTAANATDQLNTSYNTLTGTLTTWEQATTSCNQNLTCVTKEDTTAASAFNAFSSQLSATAVPSGSDAAKAKLAAVSASAAQDFTRLSQSTSTTQYQSIISSTGLQATLNAFDSDYTALMSNLQTYLAS